MGVSRSQELSSPERPDPDRALDWQPSASLEAMRMRARMFARIRAFFDERGVLEVHTPVLGRCAASDPNIGSIPARLSSAGHSEILYLQTSPEAYMKRLLASGSGPIYQLGPAFRDGESGRLHNPEFTILEWYRPGYDALALIHEVGQLCTRLLDIAQPPIVSYAEAFESTIGLDPMRCADETLFACCRRHGLQGDCAHRDEALDFLMSGVVMQQLSTRTCFIFGYPPSQAALAEIEHGLGTEDETVAFGDARIRPPFARRFELYIEGVEIANGYQELRSAAEQRARILADLAFRRDAGLPELPVDEHLLAALAHGLPSVSGVAMGLDRLLMLAMDARTIDAVLAFPVARA